MNTFRFFEFPVYKASKEFYKQILFTARKFPREYWELADQMKRSALSVCLNIAEGSAKRTQDVFEKYFSQAQEITKQLGGFSKKLRSNQN